MDALKTAYLDLMSSCVNNAGTFFSIELESLYCPKIAGVVKSRLLKATIVVRVLARHSQDDLVLIQSSTLRAWYP